MKKSGVKEHSHHIRRLRHHRNALYLIVFILLILQIVFFASISSQFANMYIQQNAVKNFVGKSIANLQEEVNSAKEENQFKINVVAQEIAQQKRDIQGEINLLKSSQNDFSAVIDEVIRGVVTVGTDKSTASGFLITEDGYVVTNQHTLSDSSYVKVQTYDGKIYDAAIVGSNGFTDVALLKIDGNFNKIGLADSDGIQIGEKVIAIGNPLGLSFSVTEGIVSATHRVGPNGLASYIQTDVTLNPGNSGGPLINKQGKVIGINNFKLGNAESLGFALESNVIEQEINKLAIIL